MNDLQTLEERATELRQIVSQPSEKEKAAAELAKLERQIAQEQERCHMDAAQDRLLRIRRALGSVSVSLDADEQRVREAASALNDAITRCNERYAQATLIRQDAKALRDRFGVPMPPLPAAIPPAERSIGLTHIELAGHRRRRPSVENDDTGLRDRRNYREISGTEAHRIIMAAGLRPFAPLTRHRNACSNSARRRRCARSPAAWVAASAAFDEQRHVCQQGCRVSAPRG